MLPRRAAALWAVAALFLLSSAAYGQPAEFELTHKGFLAPDRCYDLTPHRCTLTIAEQGDAELFKNHETKVHPMLGWYSRAVTETNPDGDRRWFDVPRFYLALEFLDGETWRPARWIGYGVSRNSYLGDDRIKGTNWAVLFLYSADNPEATIKLFDQGEHFWMFAALGTDQRARIALWDSKTWCIYLFQKDAGPAVALTSTRDVLSERDEDGPFWEHGCGPWPQLD